MPFDLTNDRRITLLNRFNAKYAVKVGTLGAA